MSAVDGHIKFSEYGNDPAHNGASTILNIPVWTLSIEIMFYLVAPFIVRSLKRSGDLLFDWGRLSVFDKKLQLRIAVPGENRSVFPRPLFLLRLRRHGLLVAEGSFQKPCRGSGILCSHPRDHSGMLHPASKPDAVLLRADRSLQAGLR